MSTDTLNQLQAFENTLRAEHTKLTAAFETSQGVAEAAWAEHMAHSDALTAFRAKYGHVLKAFDKARVSAERESVTLTPADIGTISVE